MKKSPEEYTLTVVKNKYEYEKYKCIFDVNTVDTNIFFSIVNTMQHWFFNLSKYTNIIENRYMGKGQYKALSRETIDFKNSLRSIIQNPYWYIENKLRAIFPDSILEKLKTTKLEIDNTLESLKQNLIDDINSVYPETLQG